MRLPKTISICGIPHRVISSKEESGGGWDQAKRIITIDTSVPADVPEILLHEVIEATMAIRDIRYALEREEASNEDYKFVMNHKEFDQMVKDVTSSLRGLRF